MTTSKKTLEKIEKKVRQLKMHSMNVDAMITVPWPIKSNSKEGEKFIREEIERRDQIRQEYGIYHDRPYYVIMPGKMPVWAAEEEWEKIQKQKEELK